MIVSSIINFILGMFMILPYGLFYDSIFGSLKGTREAFTWLVISIVAIVFVLGINWLMYFIYNKKRKNADKEINNLKYWLINIIVHFALVILISILL